MVATVRLYYNTGLTPANCLDSLSKLDSLGFRYHDCPQVAILQDRGRTSIKINISYDNVKDADYCKINNIGYWITSIAMSNENVAVLVLLQDYLTTVGIDNINILSGWCTRRSVVSDNFFENEIDEAFTPTEPLTIDFGTEIKPKNAPSQTSKSYKNVLVSTVDLLDTEKLADTYTDDITGFKVTVPKLPLKNFDTSYAMDFGEGLVSTKIAATCAFNADDENVKQGIANVRSLGIESSIIASYLLPNEYVEIFNETGQGRISAIEGINQDRKSSLDPKFNQLQYRNKKVFSGQFQKYILASIVSGESLEFRPEDITGDYTDESGTVHHNVVVWTLSADTTYQGHPVCRPTKFHKSKNKYWISTIKGANWQNSPIAYNTASGEGLARASRQASNFFNMAQAIPLLTSGNVNTGANLANSVVQNNAAVQQSLFAGQQASFGETLGSGFGLNAAALGVNLGQKVNNAMLRSVSISAEYAQRAWPRPELNFGMIPSLQNYIGNYFYDYRYRLSDADMIRFDRYLTQFGYAVSEPLKNECFYGRQHFNYIKAEDVNIRVLNFPLYIRDGIIGQLESGVRIWHTAPSLEAMQDNPII